MSVKVYVTQWHCFHVTWTINHVTRNAIALPETDAVSHDRAINNKMRRNGSGAYIISL